LKLKVAYEATNVGLVKFSAFISGTDGEQTDRACVAFVIRDPESTALAASGRTIRQPYAKHSRADAAV